MSDIVLTGQVGELVLITNAAVGVDINTIPGVRELGISPNASNFHYYEVRSGVCVITNPNCTIANVYRGLLRYPGLR